MTMHRTLLQKQLARPAGVTRYITEKTLERLGIAAQPLRELTRQILEPR